MKVIGNKLYIGALSTEALAQRYGTPTFVYDKSVILEKCTELKKNFPYIKIYYACKANENLEILKIIKNQGFSIETVSRGEILAAINADFKPSQISYTCSAAEKEELLFAIKHGVHIHVDSLSQLETYGKFNPGNEVSLRLNQGIGAGHHSHVITGGPKSKFGIAVSQIDEAKKIAQQYNLTITGLHQHIGSNILEEKIFVKAVDALLRTAQKFENLQRLDFGGGLGVPYKPNEKLLNLKKLGREISRHLNEFSRVYRKPLIVTIEPGRFLVAESGILLVKVTDIKHAPSKIFVGVNSGMNHLLRPSLYGSFHEIVNASRVRGKRRVVTVAGNICESGDVFAKNRKLTMPQEGDILAILNAGAYGYSMASHYNLRPLPAEVLVSGRTTKLIRRKVEAF